MSAVERAFDDYQSWTLKTAQYPEALALPYLGLGLGDEAGELLEKGAGLCVLTSREGMLAEVGDVGWYLAQLLKKLDINLSVAFLLSRELQPVFGATIHGAVTHVSVSASKVQGRLKKSIRDGVDVREPVLQQAAEMLSAMEAISRACGTNLLLVLGDNRRKLEDRLARNAIKGDGDNR